MKSYHKPRTVVRMVSVAAFLFAITGAGFGQYTVGETLSQQTRDRTVYFCANAVGSETIGDLLVPDTGEPTRVLWINFFASW